MKCRRAEWKEAGGHKKRFQYCTDSSGQEILYFRALQGQLGRNPIELSLQGQCANSGQFLRVHLSRRIYTPSWIQDWYREEKICARKDRQYFYGCEFYEQGRQRPVWDWFERIASCMVQAESGKDIKTRCMVSIYNLLNRKDLSSFKQDRTQSSFTTHSQLIVSRKLLWWNFEKSYTRT